MPGISSSRIAIPFKLSSSDWTPRYYVSNTGNDALDGLTPLNAWQTIAKVNATSFVPGDKIGFAKDGVWQESLIIPSSGDNTKNIEFGAYGAGALLPLITGFNPITEWTDKGSNIWESTNAESALAYTNMVKIGGVNTRMGIFPADITPPYQNLLVYSEQLNVTGAQKGVPWGVYPNCTITANQEVDLVGNTTLELLTITTGSARIYQTVAVVPGITYTVSWDVKRGTKTKLQFAVNDRSNNSYILSSLSSYYNETSTTVQRVTRTFTAPVGCTLVDICFVDNYNEYSIGTLYMGRVQMTNRAATYIATSAAPYDVNTGYLPYQSFVTNTTITSSLLNSAVTNWNGAEVVIKKQRWIIDRNPITGHSVSTLTYTPSSTYYGQNNWGFFIQNDIRCLSKQNDWYYNPTTKKLSVYSVGQPSDVEIATIETLVDINGHDYITLNNLSFTGANTNHIKITNSQHVTINACSFDFAGIDAINGVDSGNSNYLTITNNTINHSNNDGISLDGKFNYSLIKGNTVQNSGMIPGMGGNGDDKYIGISCHSISNTIIEQNTVINSGYNGIHFAGLVGGGDSDNSSIINNYVDNFCIVKDDGGGIYVHSSGSNKIISGNIVLNGIGNDYGVSDGDSLMVYGIYIDRNNATSGWSVTGNTVAHIAGDGIYLNGTHDNVFEDNIVFDCSKSQLKLTEGQVGDDFSGNQFDGNILFAKTATQLSKFIHGAAASFFTMNTSDNNYFARPIADDDVFMFNEQSPWVQTLYTLEEWQAFSGQETNSHKSPVTVADIADIEFYYNNTKVSTNVVLAEPMIDVKGVKYVSSITLLPFTSAVLMVDPNP